MQIGLFRDDAPGEARVALTPAAVGTLIAAGHSVVVEADAGAAAGLGDAAYKEAGASIGSVADVSAAEVVVAVRGFGTFEASAAPADRLRAGQIAIAMFDPLWRPDNAARLAETGAAVLSLELVPRITRAQDMDVLSSMATVAGYEAVLLAASRLPKMFPLMMTAAGTLTPARVLVIGAGVAGLQAIATARRLGAVVEAYDVRPAAAEQIESLGAKSIELDLATEDSEDSGGYAKALTDDQNERQREALAHHIADADVVITTAAIPGRPSPLLISEAAVKAMKPGSVVIDLAAERGGNCAVTLADEVVVVDGVTVLGPTDLASHSPMHASQMLGNNVVNLFKHLCDDDAQLILDLDDEITAAMLVTQGGEVVHPRVIDAIEKDTQ